jgi:hypothetical protein
MYTKHQTLPMRGRLPKLVAVFVIIALLLPAIRVLSQTQTAPQQMYVGVNFIKIHPGKQEQYRQLVEKYGKKVNEYLFKNQNLMGWYLYQVLIPSGSSADFDYAAVNVTGSLAALLDFPMSTKDMYKKVFPEMTDKMISDVQTQFDECRHIVRREIYTPVQGAHTDTAPNAPPSKYMQVDLMHPAAGKTADYIKMEKETFLPLHKERVKMGILKGWGLYEKILPVDTRMEYQYVTVNYYDDLNKMSDGYAESIKKLFPQKDMNAMFNETETTRTMVQSGIWKLINYVDSTNMKK